VKAEFDIRGLTSLEQRARFVSSILGKPDDLSDKDRPFLWRTTDEEMSDDMKPWGENAVRDSF
jgi:hypothetical protein